MCISGAGRQGGREREAAQRRVICLYGARQRRGERGRSREGGARRSAGGEGERGGRVCPPPAGSSRPPPAATRAYTAAPRRRLCGTGAQHKECPLPLPPLHLGVWAVMLGECSPASRPNAPRAAATLVPNAFWKLWKPAGPSERSPAAPATAPALRWPIAGTQPSGRPRAWVGAPPSGACVGRGGSGDSRAPPGIGEVLRAPRPLARSQAPGWAGPWQPDAGWSRRTSIHRWLRRAWLRIRGLR